MNAVQRGWFPSKALHREKAARAVLRDAKDIDVYVFAGVISKNIAPLMVAADGFVTNETGTDAGLTAIDSLV